ncbi:PREDICTED: transcription initiation factor TFIID subunit 4-like [Chinchilla lanigera]|uniref:transcription initiation factor TFIID subunit 4-like n=1 Tax=Chinchilla lanigera TaxID=34839 RepID=UPI0006991E1A|nr:PREDICTED: transcription initiation factor TFIID subunit 4-like [Chinchilla lanigera]
MSKAVPQSQKEASESAPMSKKASVHSLGSPHQWLLSRSLTQLTPRELTIMTISSSLVSSRNARPSLKSEMARGDPVQFPHLIYLLKQTTGNFTCCCWTLKTEACGPWCKRVISRMVTPGRLCGGQQACGYAGVGLPCHEGSGGQQFAPHVQVVVGLADPCRLTLQVPDGDGLRFQNILQDTRVNGGRLPAPGRAARPSSPARQVFEAGSGPAAPRGCGEGSARCSCTSRSAARRVLRFSSETSPPPRKPPHAPARSTLVPFTSSCAAPPSAPPPLPRRPQRVTARPQPEVAAPKPEVTELPSSAMCACALPPAPAWRPRQRARPQ